MTKDIIIEPSNYINPTDFYQYKHCINWNTHLNNKNNKHNTINKNQTPYEIIFKTIPDTSHLLLIYSQVMYNVTKEEHQSHIKIKVNHVESLDTQ